MGYGIAIHRTVEDYRNQNLLQNYKIGSAYSNPVGLGGLRLSSNRFRIFRMTSRRLIYVQQLFWPQI